LEGPDGCSDVFRSWPVQIKTVGRDESGFGALEGRRRAAMTGGHPKKQILGGLPTKIVASRIVERADIIEIRPSR